MEYTVITTDKMTSMIILSVINNTENPCSKTSLFIKESVLQAKLVVLILPF